jgi:hypothetical protein
MSKSLTEQWFDWFEERILSEFGMDVKKVAKYQPDVSPLVYCCLHHKRVPVQKREVILSKKIQDSEWQKNKDWLNLKKAIEDGLDINLYMSKSLKNWNSIDYLLYTLDIRHLHFRKNKDGGIGNELVFGVFVDEKFYAIDIGTHHNIYKAQEMVSIAEKNWPTELFRYTQSIPAGNTARIDSKEFKRFANDDRYQFNLIAPALGEREDGSSYSLNNNQNSAIASCVLNGIDYGKLPFKAWCAYDNEIRKIERIQKHLRELHGTDKLMLRIDKKRKKYVVTVCKQRQVQKEFGFSKKEIICSLYDSY